jgi:hypothetical protein
LILKCVQKKIDMNIMNRSEPYSDMIASESLAAESL